MKHVYVTLTPVEADKLSSIKLSGRCKDFTGVRVNKVKVVRPIHRKGRAIVWLCLCDCGLYVATSSNIIGNGTILSCGCDFKERDKEYQFTRRYGFGFAQRDAILNTQGSRCLGCGTYQPDGVGWVVDHNHETGDVRGVLCSTCNLILGLVKDSPERLEMLALYLKQQRTVSVETVTI